MSVYIIENDIRRIHKVFLDGEDVTRGCFFADTGRGVVHLYRRNENGRWFLETLPSGERSAAFEVKLGKVVVELKKLDTITP